MTEISGENKLEKPLLDWLERRRWLRGDAIVSRELPWLGRRIDLAILSRSGRTTAYELKLRNNKRAIQQAAYNKLAFDRSYVVTVSEPTNTNKELALQVGVGFILLQNGRTRVIQHSSQGLPEPTVRARLIRAILARARSDV